MSGEGGDGDLLGERGHGTLETCSKAHLLRGRLLRKWNLEVMAVRLWRRDTDMEDLEAKELVEGECLRVGVWLTSSRFRKRGNLCMKEGMTTRRG
jgi:hypothetical protein